MKPDAWWRPGLPGGLLSRTWAQVFVFRLPDLPRADLETSLRFKAQALLPSPDQVLRTRFFRHGGRLHGLVLVDRLPQERPPESMLTVGMPLTLPRSWPSTCLLAVETPEGWEIHRYQNRLLEASFPPAPADSPLIGRIADQFPHHQTLAFWPVASPGEVRGPLPSGFQLAPPWPDRIAWGIPWAAKAPTRWPWVPGVLLVTLGLTLALAGAIRLWHDKESRNAQWADWLRLTRPLAGAVPAQELGQAARKRSGEPLEDVFSGLSRVWPKGVEILRMELSGGHLNLTARAHSALEAVAALGGEARLQKVMVQQIRPASGQEEFDLEGEWTRDR